MYDADVGEGYADIFGTLVLLDFGLDGIPAEDVNGDGDYDDDGIFHLIMEKETVYGTGKHLKI